MTSITQTINSYIGGISQQPDEKKVPGQLVTAKNVLPDVTEGLMKRPGSKLISSLSDGSLNSSTNGKWFHYYRDENEQYVGQISRDGVLRMWDCATGSEKTVTNNLNLTSNSATYARNTSGVITVTLANHGFTQVFWYCVFNYDIIFNLIHSLFSLYLNALDCPHYLMRQY